MNGAESLIQTAVANGVDVCFANPGTTEMPLVSALDNVAGVRAILCIFEGVCTGAADGYGRMKDTPAMTLLHLGPGFANGIANLHNARRARSPIVNLIGDMATWHVANDAPLTSDIESLARPVSAWLRSVKSVDTIAQDTAEAIAAAAGRPGKVATLVLPADCQWTKDAGTAGRAPAQTRITPDEATLKQVAEGVKKHGEKAALLLGGHALRDGGLRAAARVQAATGCRVMGEAFPGRFERGAGLPVFERLPYFPEQVLDKLKGIEKLILVGAKIPVSFFGYEGYPGVLVPEGCEVIALADETQDGGVAADALADFMGAKDAGKNAAAAARPDKPSGAIKSPTFGAAIAFAQPDHAIVVDEAGTSGMQYNMGAAGLPPHTVLCLTGGAIGFGIPCATGAAVACPDRPVISIQADGSGLYTLQGLWTQAREGLNVKTVIAANRAYRILRVELNRMGVEKIEKQAARLTALDGPAVDWVAAAKAFGVPAKRVETAEDLAEELAKQAKEPGPYLIEAAI